MRLFIRATAFALACAATVAAQSGRVRRSEPTAPPAPEHSERRDALLLPPAPRGGDDAVKAGDEAGPERDSEGNRVYTARQVDRKARVLSRPEPSFPRRARVSGVQGAVVLRLLLGASGRVERVVVIKGLPEGVTEETVKAARAVKFAPAERDGRKVSQWVTFVYNFNLH